MPLPFRFSVGAFVVAWIRDPIRPPGRLARAIELRWEQLDPALRGQQVSIVLPDGVALAGKVLRVLEDAMVVDVRKTSGLGTLIAGATASVGAGVIGGYYLGKFLDRRSEVIRVVADK
jgi:hypothetical protein